MHETEGGKAMTCKQARDLLHVEQRMLSYLLTDEGVPTPRSVNGELTQAAEAAVWRLVEKRRQPAPAIVADPLPNAAPPLQPFAAPCAQSPAPMAAYEHLRAEVLWLREEQARLQAVAEAAYAALREHDARLAAMERGSVRNGPRFDVGALWRWLWRPAPRLQVPAAVPVRQEFAPTEVYYASADGGTRR